MVHASARVGLYYDANVVVVVAIVVVGDGIKTRVFGRASCADTNPWRSQLFRHACNDNVVSRTMTTTLCVVCKYFICSFMRSQ